MMFPLPKMDLWSTEDLASAADELTQQVLSRLHYAEQDAAYLLTAVTDLYSKIGDDLPRVDAVWDWSGVTNSNNDPGTGKAWIQITDGTNRVVSISKHDKAGTDRGTGVGQLLVPGTHVVLMDTPGGAVTGFRIYLITDTVQDKGTWWRFTAQRVVTLGAQDLPAAGTPTRWIIGD